MHSFRWCYISAILCMCVAGNKFRALHSLGKHSNTKIHSLAFDFLRQDLATQPWLALNL